MIQLLFIIFTWGFAHQADHLLLTQIVTQPTAGESFSIYNPTDSPIDLTNYYICDDETYYEMQTKGDMAPSHFINGFTARFPDITIDPNDTLTIVLNFKYIEYYGEDFVPDLVMYLDQGNSMIETEEGSFGIAFSDLDGDPNTTNDINPVAKLNDAAEILILFYWDGDFSNLIQDVDYFLWGSNQNAIDKTEESNYHIDTPMDNQSYFKEVAKQHYAYSRNGADEMSETEGTLDTIGNGITGHDETSENFNKTWSIIRNPEFVYGCTDIYSINYNPLAEYEIDTHYELNTGIYEFNSSLSCRYSFEQILDNEFDIGYPNIKVFGRVVDYFDIRTVADSGPQNITIEDENGYRITITVWDWEVANSKIADVLTKFNENMYYVWASGDLDFYEKYNEWQIEVSSSANIIIAQNYTTEGEYESSSTPMQTSINPEPFVLIPTLDETLDYNFTFPDKSRVIVRIFDISGRFITSLVDKYYASSGIVYCNDPPASWDGRDQLGQIVSPGTYIMHIEAMNPVTGETQTDAAPIVVGVKN